MKFKKCKHFGECGGCTMQDKSYAEQTAFKKTKLEKTLAPFWSGEIPVTPSPEAEFFRNKIELGFSHQVFWKEPFVKGKKIKTDKSVPLEFEDTLGFKLKGRWDRAIDIQECIIFEKWLIPLLNEIRAWAKAENLSYYDQRKHTGVLRHLLLRQGKNTGEAMVVLFAAQPDINTKTFLSAVEKVLPAATVLLAINTGLSDTAVPETISLLKGPGFITEKIILPKTNYAPAREVTLKLSPQSFFQTNTHASNLMYSRVRDITAQLAPATVYDLYGGAGSFSLSLADLAEKCVCVESVAPAVFDGQNNAKMNKVDNVKFFCDKVEDFLQQQAVSNFNSLIVLDPPRSGLHPKAEKAVAQCGVKNVLYISCNPVTLAENLKTLTKSYKIKGVEAFDFFPHTDHIETFVQLELI